MLGGSEMVVDKEVAFMLNINIEKARLALVGDGYLLEEVKALTEKEIIYIWKRRFEDIIIQQYYKGKRIGLYD
jgi:hypothetical protein